MDHFLTKTKQDKTKKTRLFVDVLLCYSFSFSWMIWSGFIYWTKRRSRNVWTTVTFLKLEASLRVMKTRDRKWIIIPKDLDRFLTSTDCDQFKTTIYCVVHLSGLRSGAERQRPFLPKKTSRAKTSWIPVGKRAVTKLIQTWIPNIMFTNLCLEKNTAKEHQWKMWGFSKLLNGRASIEQIYSRNLNLHNGYLCSVVEMVQLGLDGVDGFLHEGLSWIRRNGGSVQAGPAKHAEVRRPKWRSATKR